jgi:O-antigen/teichoic acid export membrane protein
MPEEYGYVALITVFTGFVTIFADAGLSFAVIRSDYKYTFHKSVNNLSFYIGILLFIVMLLLSYPIAWFYDDMTLVIPTAVMSSTFIFGALKITPMAILMKELKFNYVGMVRFVSNFLNIILMIVMAFMGMSIWALIVPQILMHIIQYAMFEYKVRIGFRFYRFSYTVAAFKKTRSLLFNLSGFNLINYWARNADNLIIGKFYSSYDLGIYSRAYKMLYLSLNLITGLFGTVLYPSLKKFKESGGEVKAEYASVLGIISLLNFPIGAVLILIPNTFVRVMWGENWIMVAELLPYFGLLIMFQTLISTIGHIFILLEKEKIFMYLGVFSAIFMVSAIVVGSLYSIKMVAAAYSLSYMLLVVPAHLYYGFFKTFGYTVSYIFKFWIPKLMLGIAILISVIFDYYNLLFIFLGLFLIHLLFYQKNDLTKLWNILLKRIQKKR